MGGVAVKPRTKYVRFEHTDPLARLADLHSRPNTGKCYVQIGPLALTCTRTEGHSGPHNGSCGFRSGGIWGNPREVNNFMRKIRKEFKTAEGLIKAYLCVGEYVSVGEISVSAVERPNEQPVCVSECRHE